MKEIIEILLRNAIDLLKNKAIIPLEFIPEIKIDRSKDSTHGDFASNIALVLSKPCKKPPRQLAEYLIENISTHPDVEKIEIAGPGFINFFIKKEIFEKIIPTVLQEAETFGHTSLGKGKKVLIEFVSANPNGPLHVGHGRGAAFGATLGNLLEAAGYQVSREYYVNDAGRQMNILAVSVWIRYLNLAGQEIVFPANGYKGSYVVNIAQSILDQYSSEFLKTQSEILENLPKDEPEGGDKEIYIDALINRAKQLLGEKGFNIFHKIALDTVLDDIRNDLTDFGVIFNTWFSENSLMSSGAIDKGIQALNEAGYTFTKDGALWFRATSFGDEKDRVLIRANGQSTYFASDVAYHWDKFNRGFDRVIDIFGADHHGYSARVKAAVNALGHDDNAINILYVQFAILYRGHERVQMSTRSGSFVTLRELREEIGKDAARFFYVMRKPDQHLDFDLDLAKSESSDNPVYYIQYAHARISSVLRQLNERGLTENEHLGLANIDLLKEPHEKLLMTLIARYPEVIETAALACEPHQIAYYLRELANSLHSYYNAVVLLCEQETLRCARLCLLKAVRQVIRNGLCLLGVSTPEKM